LGARQNPSTIVNKITRAIKKATEDSGFIKFAETQMLCKVEYRNPEKTKEDTVNYDKVYGPKLVEMNR
jgi:hypothetical protein